MPEGRPLTGLSIVVTRPSRQGAITAKALRAAGAVAIEFPVLSIAPCAATMDAEILAHAYAVIFVSANAVEHGVGLLRANGGVPARALVAAIGEATARALQAGGFADVVSPQQSIDSEGLLALPQLQSAAVKGQHIILVRGKSAGGGRRMLETTLGARGAKVTALECYERLEFSPPIAHIESLVESLKVNFAVMALSVETIESMLKLFAAHPSWLRNAWLLVPHARVAAAARERGFARVAEVGMSAESLIAGLLRLKPRFGFQKN